MRQEPTPQLHFHRLVGALESDPAVRVWHYRDFELWPLVKFWLSTVLDTYVTSRSSGQSVVHAASVVQRVAFALRTVLENGALVSQAAERDVILCYSSHRYCRRGPHWYHAFHDSLRHFYEDGGRELVAVEIHNLPEPREPALSPSISATRDVMLARVTARTRPIPTGLRAVAADVVETVRSHVGDLAIEAPALSASELCRSIVFVDALARRFARLLNRIAPRRAYVVNYYSRSALALCLAGRRVGIPVADVSHGLSNRWHYAYGTWRWHPPDGFRLLPSAFLARTRDDAEATRDLQPSHVAVEVGDVFAHAWRADAYGIRTGAPSPPASTARRSKDARINVLLALQFSAGLSAIDAEIVRASSERQFFWIRLHPLWVRHGLGSLGDSLPRDRFDHEFATDAPLFAVFDRVDVVITECSSVAADALAFGIPSIITSELGRRAYSREIQRGEMAYCASTEAVLARLDAMSPAARSSVSDDRTAAQRETLRRVIRDPTGFSPMPLMLATPTADRDSDDVPRSSVRCS